MASSFGIKGFSIIDTPESQRRRQKIRAKSDASPIQVQRALEEEYGRHAGDQFNKYLQSRTFGSRLRTAERGLGLREQALQFDRYMFNKAMKGREAERFWGGLLGLGNIGYDMYSGYRNKQLLLDEKKARNKEVYGIYDYLRKSQLGVPYGLNFRYGGR